MASILDSFLNPGRGYEAGENALLNRFLEAQRRQDEAKKYLIPYNEHGNEQYGRLNEGINQLLHPEELMNRFISGYQESPYTKQLIEQNRQRGLESASSMGLMGSSAAINNIQQGAGQIANEQREQYLKDLMQQYLSGLGLSSDIYKTGAGAGANLLSSENNMANLLAKLGEDEASLEYGRESAPGNLFNNLLRTAGGAAGGFMLGGAPGALFGAASGGGYLR